MCDDVAEKLEEVIHPRTGALWRLLQTRPGPVLMLPGRWPYWT